MPVLPQKISMRRPVLITDPGKRHARELRNTRTWRTVRVQKLHRNPLCENPFNAHSEIVPAVEVHHKIELSRAPGLAYVMGNLQSLCSECHARQSHRERGMVD